MWLSLLSLPLPGDTKLFPLGSSSRSPGEYVIKCHLWVTRGWVARARLPRAPALGSHPVMGCYGDSSQCNTPAIFPHSWVIGSHTSVPHLASAMQLALASGISASVTKAEAC